MTTVLVTFLCSNCSHKTKEAISIEEREAEELRHNKLASDICACTKEVVAVYKELLDANGFEKDELQKEIEKELEKSEACISQLNDGEGMKDFKKDLTDSALKANCPEFYNMWKIGRIR